MLLESLIIKGLWTASHWLAAHGTSAAAAKGGVLIMNSITTHGFAATASSVIAGALTTGLVVGSVTFGVDAVKTLLQLVKDIQDGNRLNAAYNAYSLLRKLHVGIDVFPDVVTQALEHLGMNPDLAQWIGQEVRSMENQILKFSGTDYRL